tara:strand:- start:32 stop:622 length:591 start_codon:yes stop_codon:yes gene_type:complete
MSDISSYRIVRLVNGEKLIAKISGSKKNKLYLERPMVIEEITGTQTINPLMAIKREYIILQNWIEFSKSNVVGIPKEHILTIYDPDELVTMAYNKQKEREDTGSAGLLSMMDGDSEDKLTDMIDFDNMKQSDITDIVNDIINGNINSYKHMHEENVDEDWIDSDIDKGRNDYGNELDDWSPYIEDYFFGEDENQSD